MQPCHPPPTRGLGALAVGVALAACGGGQPDTVGDGAVPVAQQNRSAAAEPGGPADGSVLDPGPLPERGELSGDLTPTSVVASGACLVVAQSMISTHIVSAFNSNGKLLSTIDDTIVAADLGHQEWTEEVEGGPVEAAFSTGGSRLWVSSCSMYGPGFDRPGDDVCTPDTGIDPSFLHRIDTEAVEIVEAVEAVQAVQVGAVPELLAVTPDGAHVLVTSWCTWDLSVVATNGGEATEVARVPIDRCPRGIAISPDSSTAYVAVMGSSKIAVLDIAAAADGAGDDAVEWFEDIGRGPRHLNLSPDGTVLFVVNDESATVSRVRTSDLEVLETVPVDHHPIGITYDALTQRIWVASYGGTIAVLDDHPQ